MTPETVLIVDDERDVRETFIGWLREAQLGCQILAAASVPEALNHANQQTIDLAVLDWNLGAGLTGLDLLEDLQAFNPDIVAVMITGYAHQATPLMAMRLGVRDYLDKNQGLTRELFLGVVQRQLERIRPARLQRRVNEGLAAFHHAVEQVLPLVQTAAALNDPVPVSAAARAVIRYAISSTGASHGVLVLRTYEEASEPREQVRAYDPDGQELPVPLAFSASLAAATVGMGRPCVLEEFHGIGLQPFETGRVNLLAVPLELAAGHLAVLELFDRPGGFDAPVQQQAADLGALATEVLRQALAERETSRLLLHALLQAQRIGQEVREQLRLPDSVAPPEVRARLEATLAHRPDALIDPAPTLRLAEAIRRLAATYGTPAVDHCTRLVEGLNDLLREVTQ
ncbi:MAG: response regulator [Gemmataceae bacterium]